MDRNKSLIIPFTPTSTWELNKREIFISLGKHWPLQALNSDHEGFIDSNQCEGSLYLFFTSSGDTSPIQVLCDTCKLRICGEKGEAFVDRFGVRNVPDLKMSLARLILAGAWRNRISPIASFPETHYLVDSMWADIPLLDTGFSTQDGKLIYLGYFLPHRIGGWDLDKGEWVPQEAYENLSEAAVLVLDKLVNNRRSLEITDKRILGH